MCPKVLKQSLHQYFLKIIILNFLLIVRPELGKNLPNDLSFEGFT